MQIIAVDDEKLILENLVDCIKEAAPDDTISSFQRPSEALGFAKENTIDVAFLDIQMRGMNGLDLGRELKQLQPNVNIIFCTGFSDYIFEAVSQVRCSGYLLKPASVEDVQRELENLRVPVAPVSLEGHKVYMQCFGNFECFVDGQMVQFARAKTKELLAYLVDRKGSNCTNGELETVLWEDDKDHRAYLKKCRKDLADTLAEIKCENILQKSWGGLAINREQIECDYYNWLENKPDGIKAFNGEYMEQYSWAEITKGALLD